MMQAYKTIQIPSKTEQVINRSRFIGQCFPVRTEGEALMRLNEVRKEYADASHVCYAYRIGERGETTRFSDAGEPGGTAGMPILDVLQAKGLVFVLCTVTRYFGGVLLGAGGLVRAYSGSATQAADAAGTQEHIPGMRFLIRAEYPRYGALENFLRGRATVEDCRFAEDVTLVVTVPAREASGFVADVIEQTDGRCPPESLGECDLILNQ